MKKKLWKTRRADDEFSLWIRMRDGKCVFCGKTENLTNSHYWGRFASSTRYDKENCDALCMRCHFVHENAKQGYYKEWKEKQLGKERYDALRKKYYQGKMNRTEAIKELMAWMI